MPATDSNERFYIDLICTDNRCGGMLTVTAPWPDSMDHQPEVPYECPDCSGEMEKSGRPMAVRSMFGPCPRCKGEGEISVTVQRSPGIFRPQHRPCPRCRGAGEARLTADAR